MANIFDEILAALHKIHTVLEAGAAIAGTAEAVGAAVKPKASTAAKGPTLEEVQDKIRTLAEKDGMKDLIKAAITKLGGKRAGDFEGDPVKLGKLSDALDNMDSTPAADDTDDDLL